MNKSEFISPEEKFEASFRIPTEEEEVTLVNLCLDNSDKDFWRYSEADNYWFWNYQPIFPDISVEIEGCEPVTEEMVEQTIYLLPERT